MLRAPALASFLIAAAIPFALALPSLAESPIAFDDYFTNAALRIEFYQTGNAHEELITEHEIYEEPIWPENPHALIPPFDYGLYNIKVYDKDSNRLIYVRGFNSMFSEYKTTRPALDGVKKTFEEAIRIPCPKKPVKVVFERREKSNALTPVYTMTVDPADYHIIRETPDRGDSIFEIQNTGDPHDRVDFVFLSEGYTAADKDKFKADAERFANFLFTVDPYKGSRDKFNVRAVFRPSAERGMDGPRQHSFKSTALNASYNAFDLDRYMLVEDSFAMHRMAAQVPYDTIVVLVNSTRYGGGSMCLDYCVTTVDNRTSERIFVHELGHSFAYLADEYTGDVAYNDFYPKGVEPIDPNITALLDPKNIKWKALLTPGVAIPTESGQGEIRSLQAELQTIRKQRDDEIAAAKTNSATEEAIKQIQDREKTREDEIQAKIKNARDKLANVVGAFEGAGYSTTGLYRSQLNCLMGNNPKPEFCAVCRQAIQTMINHYADGNR